jgi:hypothetical protein
MSEYEAALFEAVRILGGLVVKMGGDETALLTQLRESKSLAEENGRRNEAATLGFLITFLCEPPEFYEVRPPDGWPDPN